MLPRFRNKGPIAVHGNTRRHAEHAVVQAVNKLDAGSTVKTGIRFTAKVVLFIELMTSTGSRFAASFGPHDYVLKVVQPRLGPHSKKTKHRPIAKYPPAKPPELQRGKRAMWRLDLRAVTHQEVFFAWLRDVKVPADVKVLHGHSSPPCRWVFTGIRIQSKLKFALETTCQEGATLLYVCRQMHSILQQKVLRRGVILSGSHEQTARSSTSIGLKILKPADRHGIQSGWPWAVDHRCPRVSISGAAVGTATSTGQLTTKRWTFESRNVTLISVLRRFSHAPEGEELVPMWSTKGVPGAASSQSEKYTSFLGMLLAAAIRADVDKMKMRAKSSRAS